MQTVFPPNLLTNRVAQKTSRIIHGYLRRFGVARVEVLPEEAKVSLRCELDRYHSSLIINKDGGLAEPSKFRFIGRLLSGIKAAFHCL